MDELVEGADNTPSMSDKIQGWIKATWPILITAIGLILFVKDMQRDNDVVNAIQDQRLCIIEECQQDMQEALTCLQEQQGITNYNIATLTQSVENLNTNVVRIIEILDTRY